jgi:hypothetical protein
MSRRYVKQNAAGGWDVLKDGQIRSAVSADSKDKAVARARDMVRREGGGEIRVMSPTGKIANTLSAGGGRRTRSASG